MAAPLVSRELWAVAISSKLPLNRGSVQKNARRTHENPSQVPLTASGPGDLSLQKAKLQNELKHPPVNK
jgi:hypothetical protein